MSAVPRPTALAAWTADAPNLVARIESDPTDPALNYLRLQILALRVHAHLEPIELYGVHPPVEKAIIDPRESTVACFSAGPVTLSRLTFFGKSSGQVWFGNRCSVKNVQINCPKGYCTIIFGPNCELSNSIISVSQSPGSVIFASGVTGSDLNIQIGEAQDYVLIGDDCMFSNNVAIRTSDNHAIFDLETGRRINHSRPVILHRHVWVARQVIIGKGTEIGADAVIGQGSLVGGRLEENAIHAGVPAKPLRKGVTWDRIKVESLEETRVIEPHRIRQLNHVRTCERIDAYASEKLVGLPPMHAISRLLATTCQDQIVRDLLDALAATAPGMALLCAEAHRLRLRSGHVPVPDWLEEACEVRPITGTA